MASQRKASTRSAIARLGRRIFHGTLQCTIVQSLLQVALWHFCFLVNILWFQVTRMSTGSCICFISWSRLWYWQVATSEFCCTKPTISTIYRMVYNRYSGLTPCHTLLTFVALLTLRVRASQGCCWSGLVLAFCGLPTSYQLILLERNPRSSCASTSGDSLGKKSASFDAWSFDLTYLSHWPTYISFKQDDGMVPKMWHN